MLRLRTVAAISKDTSSAAAVTSVSPATSSSANGPTIHLHPAHEWSLQTGTWASTIHLLIYSIYHLIYRVHSPIHTMERFARPRMP